MPTAYDEPDDDEDWYDADDDEADEPDFGRCPECGGAVYDFFDRCPACGRWLMSADRRRMFAGESHAAWIKIVAVALLIMFVAIAASTCGLF